MVLNAMVAAGIDREQVTSVDASKIDDALDVTELSETDVYNIEDSEYVRKADVDEEEKETRLQGLKDRLTESESEEDLDMLDVSHATQTDDPLAVPPADVEGKRFDHMIASRDLNPQACWYDQDGFRFSDHAPLFADFQPEL